MAGNTIQKYDISFEVTKALESLNKLNKSKNSLNTLN